MGGQLNRKVGKMIGRIDKEGGGTMGGQEEWVGGSIAGWAGSVGERVDAGHLSKFH